MFNIIRNARTMALVAVLALFCQVSLAQTRVSGTVLDEGGLPLPGASVIEAGTSNGTITDLDGQFTLSVAAGATLEVSFIGFKPLTVTAPADGKLTVTLAEDKNLLNEVVVVGYGTMARKDVTSSITTIKSDELNKGVFVDAGSMLQGKVAGLVVTTNGDPNGGPSMTLRGASSLRTGAMSPYYVIDGIPGVDISMVAPDDIESIDVLRDATATAIYGSKAANGVIIVTTKKGKHERVNVAYSGYVALDTALKTLDMASAADIRQYVKDNSLDYQYDEGANTSWKKEVIRPAVSHNHNISVNGGGKKTTYMASINYVDRQGVVKGSNMNRINVRSLVGAKILKEHLELSAGVNAMFGKNVGVPMGDEGASVLDAMNYFNPTLPIKTQDGSDWSHGKGSANYNPLSLINEDKSETQWRRMQFIGKAKLNIIDGLSWSANVSYNNYQSTYSAYHTHQSQIQDKYGFLKPDNNGLAQRSTNMGHTLSFETYGNYDKTFNEKHKLSLMAGYSWEEHKNNDGFGVSVHNFFDDSIGWNNLTYAGVIDGPQRVESGTIETVRNISFYGRVGYSFDSRYMFQVTVRGDGSSVFAKGKQWGAFPSASFAWNIAEEEFMKNQDTCDQLKLRVGYGMSGNAMGFGAYSGVQTYGSTGQYANGYVMLSATKLANPDLKWETTGMFNVGVDYGFLKGRINGSLEFYYKNTWDLIWDYPVSSYIYPFDSIAANVGAITNIGAELSINAIAVQTKDFTWNTTLNLSHNTNRVDKLSNDLYRTSTFSQGDPMVAGVSANGWTQRIMEGQPIGTFYTYQWAGTDADGVSVYYTRDAETKEIIRDAQGNPVTTKDPQYKDRTVTGCAQPKLNLGWNNTFTYKDLSISAFFTGVFGQQIYNGLRAHYTAPDFFAGGKNVLKEFITTRDPKDTGSNIPSDKFIERGDYFRLQSLTIGYTFRNLAEWMQSIQIYATMNNVFTITGYKGLDPEVSLGGITPGVDYRWNTYPHTRTTMIGIKINF